MAPCSAFSTMSATRPASMPCSSPTACTRASSRAVTEHRIAVEQIAPFLTLADEAVAGKKLFAITHSAITTTYASTTQTADFLLAQESVDRVAPTAPAPRPGMTPTSRADSGNFHVMGFDGGNEQAHCDHLHAFGDTLLPYLKERWR